LIFLSYDIDLIIKEFLNLKKRIFLHILNIISS
jgi:hypothetical protein